MTRMVLVKCANPRCWRYFPKAAESPARCCDEACERQAQTLEAWQARQAQAAKVSA